MYFQSSEELGNRLGQMSGFLSFRATVCLPELRGGESTHSLEGANEIIRTREAELIGQLLDGKFSFLQL